MEREDSFAEAVDQSLDIAKGRTLAEQAITDAVIATLLRAFPALSVGLHATLASTAQDYRDRMEEDDPLVHTMFDRRIAQATQKVEALSGR